MLKAICAIPYQRPHGAWHAISASRVLDPDAPIPSLRNQIVLIRGYGARPERRR